jgi:predicted pyridoxine 5'-phosphate oxidase superfamily flavin-nucleotide-binding protein
MISSIYGVVMDSRAKDRVLSEVTSEGARIMQIITQTTRNGILINTPSIGNNDSVLSINVLNGTNNPTMFYIVGDNIVIKEGVATEIILNSNRTKVSGLKFTNLTRVGTKGTVKIEYTVTAVSTNPRAPYQFSQTFYSDATLK